MEKYRILVVDDEEDICEILKYNLVQSGYEVDTASSAEDAIPMLKNPYHLILLDIMMAGMSGTTMARLLREDYNIKIPIVFISALDTEPDILKGFSIGADDYISTLFSIKEVIARVGAVLKSVYAANSSAPKEAQRKMFSFHDFNINYVEKRGCINHEEIILTKKECDIVVLLAMNADEIFCRAEILQY